jgi:hypothetical protein
VALVLGIDTMSASEKPSANVESQPREPPSDHESDQEKGKQRVPSMGWNSTSEMTLLSAPSTSELSYQRPSSSVPSISWRLATPWKQRQAQAVAEARSSAIDQYLASERIKIEQTATMTSFGDQHMLSVFCYQLRHLADPTHVPAIDAAIDQARRDAIRRIQEDLFQGMHDHLDHPTATDSNQKYLRQLRYLKDHDLVTLDDLSRRLRDLWSDEAFRAFLLDNGVRVGEDDEK